MPNDATSRADRLWTKDFLMLSAVNFGGALIFYLLMVVMTDYSMNHYGVSYSDAALSVSAYILGALVTRIVLGKQIDKWGIKKSLVIGAVVNAIMSCCYLISMPYWTLVAARFVHGLGFALTSSSSAAGAALVIPASRKAEGIGYFSLTQALATGIGPFVSILLTQDGGDPVVLFGFTAGVAILALLGAIVLHVPAASEATGAKTELNQAPAADAVLGKGAFARWAASFIQISVLPLGIVMFLMYICYAGVLSFVVPFANENGLQEAVSVYFLVYAVTILITRPPIGKLVDIKGENPIVYITLSTLVVGLAVLSTAATGTVLLLTAVLIGFGLGATQSTAQAIMARDTPAAQLGRAHSTFYALMDLGSGIGPMIIGAFIPLVGYSAGYLFLAGLAVITLITYHLLHGRYVKTRRAATAAASEAEGR